MSRLFSMRTHRQRPALRKNMITMLIVFIGLLAVTGHALTGT